MGKNAKENSNVIKICTSLRNTVWNENIGSDSKNGFCYCCIQKPINFSNFRYGHLINIKDGGRTNSYNLKPICSNCNISMGDKNMLEFMASIGIDDIYPQDFLTKLDRLGYTNEFYKYVKTRLGLPPESDSMSYGGFDNWCTHDGMMRFDFNSGNIFNENNNKIIDLFSKFVNNKKIIVNSSENTLYIVIVSNDVYEQYNINDWNNYINYYFLPCEVMDFKKQNTVFIIADLLKRIIKINNNTHIDNSDYYLKFKAGIYTGYVD
jgi:hypothetical protein